MTSDISSKCCFIEDAYSQTIDSPVISMDPANVYPITESRTSSKLATPRTGSDQGVLPQGSGSKEPSLAPSKHQNTSDDGTDDVMDTAGSSMDEGEITDYSPATPTNEGAIEVSVRQLGHDQHLRQLESNPDDAISHPTEISESQNVQDESMLDASAPDAPYLAPTSSSSGRSMSLDYMKDGTERLFVESSQEEGEIEMGDSDDYEPPEPASPALPVEENASPSPALPLASAPSSASAGPLIEIGQQAAPPTSPLSAEARQPPAAITRPSVSPHKVRKSALAWYVPNFP